MTNEENKKTLNFREELKSQQAEKPFVVAASLPSETKVSKKEDKK